MALVLAGGQGRRMGGADKGLQPWCDHLLIDAVLVGIAQQTRPVQTLAISANRNPGTYAQRAAASWGVGPGTTAPLILKDDRPGWPGPLAGVEAGLAHLPDSAQLWTLPCDVPQFPAHTLQALLSAQAPDRKQPVWVRSSGRDHPTCALWPSECAPAVSAALDAGQHAVLRLLRDLGGHPVDVQASHPHDFANINTLDDLRATPAPGLP